MSIKLDTSNGHPRVPQIVRSDHWLLAIDTLSIPSLAMFQSGCVDRKTEKSRIEFEAEFRLKSLDNK